LHINLSRITTWGAAAVGTTSGPTTAKTIVISDPAAAKAVCASNADALVALSSVALSLRRFFGRPGVPSR
jgi:hypothetical protein